MAHSTVEVFNLALAWLGGEQLSSVESTWENSTLGILCKNNFSGVLNSALAAADWNFATKRIQLARKIGAIPHPQYSFRYSLPADCLRPGHLMGADPGGDFIIEQRDILTSQNPAQLAYVAKVEDPRLWPPGFVMALSWGLAAILATARLGDSRKQVECLKHYERALAEAWAIDRNQGGNLTISSQWLIARGSDSLTPRR